MIDLFCLGKKHHHPSGEEDESLRLVPKLSPQTLSQERRMLDFMNRGDPFGDDFE
jgi:hypothetical protein